MPIALKDPVHTRPPDAEPLGDLRGAEARLPKPPHVLRLDARPSPLVDSPRLGRLDALDLPLPAESGLKLRERTKHVEENLARCRARVDGLLRGPQVDAL